MTAVAQAEVASALDQTRRGLDVPVGEMTAEDRAAVATDLRVTVDRTLRPLSHRLHAAASARSPTGPSRRLTEWSALRTLPLFPLPTAVTAGLLVLPMSQGLLGPVIYACSLWLAVALPVAFGRRVGWPRRWVVPLALVLAAFTSTFAGLVAGRTADGVASPAVFAAVGGLSVAVTLVVSAIGAVLRGEGEVNKHLLHEVTSREVDALIADREIARASRELAQHLHGTVQSRLLATAVALDEAASRDDDQAFRRALTQARAALEDVAVAPGPTDDLPGELARVAALWRGFMHVRVRVRPDLPQLTAATVAKVARIAEEAVGNARKHGDARHVAIDVQSVPEGVLVQVTDDGRGPTAGVPGMGSAWLDFVAPGEWALEAGPGGSGAVLQVRLPCGAIPVPRSRVAPA